MFTLYNECQVFFESSMYIFITQWPPALSSAVIQVFSHEDGDDKGNDDIIVPYGTVFSCFMTCCLLGSNLFIANQQKQSSLAPSTNNQKELPSKEKKSRNTTIDKSTALIINIESFMHSMLLCATCSMSLVVVSQFLTIRSSRTSSTVSIATAWESLILLIIGFFSFECCVGMYFPVSFVIHVLNRFT